MIVSHRLQARLRNARVQHKPFGLSKKTDRAAYAVLPGYYQDVQLAALWEIRVLQRPAIAWGTIPSTHHWRWCLEMLVVWPIQVPGRGLESGLAAPMTPTLAPRATTSTCECVGGHYGEHVCGKQQPLHLCLLGGFDP